MAETGSGGVTMRTLDVRVGADGMVDSMYARQFNPFRPAAGPILEVELRFDAGKLRTRQRQAAGPGGKAALTTKESTLQPGTRLAALSPAGVE